MYTYLIEPCQVVWSYLYFSQCKCVVVNVEYRLSPEHKYPAAYDDAKAIVEWCQSNKKELANNDSAIVGVAGDSAGGSLSASSCHLLKNLDYQVNTSTYTVM